MNRRLNKAVNAMAHSLGCVLIPKWRLPTYAQAEFLRKLFPLAEVDLVLDVGANTGQYRDFLRNNVGYTGTIISFEPVPRFAETIARRAARDAKWEVQHCALGALEGEAEINVMHDGQFSSFLEPDHSVVSLFASTNRVEQRLKVPVLTLDGFLRGRDLLAKTIYLKLDTQGFDLEVVKGATTAVDSIVALQTEASMKPIYSGAPDLETTIKFFESRGFEPSGIFPNNAGHFPLLIEFDLHMVAKRILSSELTKGISGPP